MGNFLADLRFAFRGLRRNPLFAAVAILSLALGIGANTAIFTLLDQLLLRQLPINDPDSLVMLYQQGPHNGSNMGGRMHSYPIYQDYQQKGQPFSEVLCRRLVSASLAIDNQTERITAELVSGNFFTMLGVKPAVGRVFNSKEDDQVYQGHPVAVLSYEYWMRRFSGDRSIVGKKVYINNYPMTVVGVSAAGFAGVDPARTPQVRVPILMKETMMPEMSWFHLANRRTRWVQVFARLKPGYTVASAQPPMQGLFRQVREYEMTLPAAKDWSPYLRQQFMKGTLQIERADTGYSNLRNDFSKALVVLMCMVGVVLLIACANVANLLIARAFARQKEIAVRLSMGASRGQLVRQLLVESMVLSLAGGIAGTFLAVAMSRVLLALVPSEGSPLLLTWQPDLRILLFTLGLTILTGLIFGIVPALRASRPDPWNTLKDTAGAVAGGGSLFFRRGLVAAQVALSFMLLFGAGLFVKSLQNLKTTNTGFKDLDNLVSFQLSPAYNGYDDARVGRLYNDLLERLRATPGVKSAGMASVPVLAGDEWDSTTSVEGHKAKDGEDMQAFMNSLSPGYFEAMGVPIIEGRDFDRRDMKEDAKVAIVNERFAKHFFGDKSAIGRHLGRGGGPNTKLDIEIIGVTADTLYEGPREGVRRQVFVPKWGNGSAVVYVRVAMDSSSAYSVLRGAVKQLDPSLPVYGMKTLGTTLDETLLTERLIAMLSAGFGFLATILAAVGLYGVMAFVVARRTKEMGIRMALGARPGRVLWLVMKEVIVLWTVGLVIGVPVALALGRYIATQLYGIKANDPVVTTLTIAMCIAVSTAAGFVPAHRTSRIDPVRALHYE